MAAALTGAALLWSGAILFTPLPASARHTPVVAALVRGVGALVCHQQPQRSFHVHGRPLPVCARCTALYLSGAIGAVAGWFGLARIPRRIRTILLVSALPTAATVVLEMGVMMDPGNAGRALAGLPLGGAAGWLFVRMLREEAPPGAYAMIS